MVLRASGRVNDGGDDGLYSRVLLVATMAWLRGAPTPTCVGRVCVSFSQDLCLLLSLGNGF